MKRIKHSIANGVGKIIGDGYLTKKQCVAVKQFCYEEIVSKNKDVLSRNQALKIFKSEYDTLSSLDHSGIVKVYRYVDNGSVPYYVMEYIDGSSLAEYVYKRGPLHWQEAKKIVISVCETLKYCHSHGITHGDITPNNVIIGEDGRITLIDFCPRNKRLDYLGLGFLYFDMLTKRYISIPDLYISPRSEIEYAHQILMDKQVPKSIISHILYLFGCAGISSHIPSIDFILNAIRKDSVLPYYKKGIVDRIIKNDKGKASTFAVFCENNKWGMKNRNGSIVIPPIYDEIRGVARMAIPGPGPLHAFVGVKTRRGSMTGWYQLNDNMELEFLTEITDWELRKLSMLS